MPDPQPVRPMMWCDECGYGTNDPSELVAGRADTVWCVKRYCGGKMNDTPPPSSDSSAPPDTETVRTVERDPDDPGVVRLGTQVVDHRAGINAQTVDLLRSLLAAAERGEFSELVGVAYDSDGVPQFFCSHRDSGRACGALTAAQHTVLQRWLG